MTDNPGKLHFKASSHCALCRESLPDPEYAHSASEAWEYKVLGIWDLTSTNTPFGIVATRADLTYSDSCLGLSVTPRNGSTPLKVEICLSSECPSCEGPFCTNTTPYIGDKIAYFVHLDCWKLINTSKTNHTVISSLYKLARSTYPLFEYGDRLERQMGISADIASAAIGVDPETEEGRLIRSISFLPAEIQLYISKYCSRNLLSSLLTVIHKSTPLLDLIKRNGSSQITIDITCSAIVDTLSARLVSIYDQRYISLLRYNQTINLDMKDQHSISVKRSEIKGIRFVINRYGLRAISILYSDDSTSAWLGDETGGWKGVMYGDNLRGLRVIQDDLKYLRIDLIEVDMGSNALPRDLVMWDKDLRFLSTQSNQIFEYVGEYLNEYLNGGPQVRNYPGWRLCNYLPFVDGKGYMTGLTMYCDGHSITGMIAHGESNRLIGHRQGCPIHLRLHHNERIISVWVRTPHDSISMRINVEPTILVTTSHHRTCIFGPHLPQHYSQFRRYAWTNLSTYPSSDILGIFYDALLVTPRRQITTIGTTQVIKSISGLAVEKLPNVPTVQKMPPMLGTVMTNSFISIGTFSHVQRLEVCRVESQCMGISIWHDDDTIEVLGQWDLTHSSTISDIYNCNEGILTSVTFYFSGSISKSHIEDISCGIDNEEPIQNEHSVAFYVKQSHQPVAWWFTRTCDHVELWSGRLEEIVVSNRTCRVMNLR